MSSDAEIVSFFDGIPFKTRRDEIDFMIGHERRYIKIEKMPNTKIVRRIVGARRNETASYWWLRTELSNGQEFLTKKTWHPEKQQA